MRNSVLIVDVEIDTGIGDWCEVWPVKVKIEWDCTRFDVVSISYFEILSANGIELRQITSKDIVNQIERLTPSSLDNLTKNKLLECEV